MTKVIERHELTRHLRRSEVLDHHRDDVDAADPATDGQQQRDQALYLTVARHN